MKEIIDFLRDLSCNNNREWFTANKQRYEAGILKFQAAVEGGHVQEIAFYGDFLATSPMSPLPDALIGCAFRREDVATVLDRFDLTSLFGGITKDEILNVIF